MNRGIDLTVGSIADERMASDLTVVSALGFSRAEALVKLLPLSGQREREKENGNGLTFEAMLMMPSRYVRIRKCKPRGIYDSGKVKVK